MDKYLELLQRMANIRTGEESEALRAAIELMRAAEPLDEKAEREHCERFAREWLNGGDGPPLEDEVMRERAAVRAEGYKAGAAAVEMGKGYVLLGELQAQLSAAQTEHARQIAAAEERMLAMEQGSTRRAFALDRVERDLKETHEWRRELQTKLSAAQARVADLETRLFTSRAQIEQLKGGQCDAQAANGQYITELETKLTNLRTAAEHYHAIATARATDGRDDTAFGAAIEASR